MSRPDIEAIKEHYRGVCTENCGKCEECIIPGLLEYIEKLENVLEHATDVCADYALGNAIFLMPLNMAVCDVIKED